MKLLIIEPIPDSNGLLDQAIQAIEGVQLRVANCWMEAIPFVRNCWPDLVVADWAAEQIDNQLKVRALVQMQQRGIGFLLWAEDSTTVPAELRGHCIGKDAGLQVLRSTIEMQAMRGNVHACNQ
jgi:hypothetical protein